MPYENILYEKDGATATITLNRPDKLNALSPDEVVDHVSQSRLGRGELFRCEQREGLSHPPQPEGREAGAGRRGHPAAAARRKGGSGPGARRDDVARAGNDDARVVQVRGGADRRVHRKHVVTAVHGAGAGGAGRAGEASGLGRIAIGRRDRVESRHDRSGETFKPYR